MTMYMFDILASVSLEAKVKLDEEKEEERKKRDQDQHEQEQLMFHKDPIQLEPMAIFKRKRSERERFKRVMMDSFDDQLVSDNLHRPELDQAAAAAEAEDSDHHCHHEEEERKKAIPQKKKRNIGVKKQKYKKKKVVDNGSDNPPRPDLPVEFKNLIKLKAESKGVLASEEILVIQKALTMTDIKDQQNRFSIPVKKMIHEFLEPEEVAFYEQHNGKHCNTRAIDIIEPSGTVEKVNLSRWEMKKEKGKSSVSYVLKGDWGMVVASNNLEEHDMVQLWAVRIGTELCFAFVVLPKEGECEDQINAGNASMDSCVGGDQGDGEAEASTSGVDKSDSD